MSSLSKRTREFQTFEQSNIWRKSSRNCYSLFKCLYVAQLASFEQKKEVENIVTLFLYVNIYNTWGWPTVQHYICKVRSHVRILTWAESGPPPYRWQPVTFRVWKMFSLSELGLCFIFLGGKTQTQTGLT